MSATSVTAGGAGQPADAGSRQLGPNRLGDPHERGSSDQPTHMHPTAHLQPSLPRHLPSPPPPSSKQTYSPKEHSPQHDARVSLRRMPHVWLIPELISINSDAAGVPRGQKVRPQQCGRSCVSRAHVNMRPADRLPSAPAHVTPDGAVHSLREEQSPQARKSAESITTPATCFSPTVRAEKRTPSGTSDSAAPGWLPYAPEHWTRPLNVRTHVKPSPARTDTTGSLSAASPIAGGTRFSLDAGPPLPQQTGTRELRKAALLSGVSVLSARCCRFTNSASKVRAQAWREPVLICSATCPAGVALTTCVGGGTNQQPGVVPQKKRGQEQTEERNRGNGGGDG